jgi:Rps23 Pro-64 3,4-dihydroxylase Tpa1-like proline 4-hydroxylase
MDRTQMAKLIADQLRVNAVNLKAQYQESKNLIGYFVLDDLLPCDLVTAIYERFPFPDNMRLRKSLREFKYVAAQMNSYDPLLEEAVYAFQGARVVELIAEICGVKMLYPDHHLYAGGISLMGNKQFLNPHVDNSHDKDRKKWRVLNLLYYVTPDWERYHGGNLELWPNGMRGHQITIHSKFNRLVVMATHDASWHSVSPISQATHNRCCISNYYFSDVPLKSGDSFHVTSFRGRPEQKVRDLVLRADKTARMAIRGFFKKGIVETKHIYKKESETAGSKDSTR